MVQPQGDVGGALASGGPAGAKLLLILWAGFGKQICKRGIGCTQIEGGYGLTRGTGDKAHPQPAFNVFCLMWLRHPCRRRQLFGS